MFSLTKNIFLLVSVTAVTMVAWLSYAGGDHHIPVNLKFGPEVPADTSKKEKRDKTKPNYQPKDRLGDPYSNRQSESPLLLPNPSNVETEISLDSVNGTYTIRENVGNVEYRPASTMTFEEYQKYRDREMLKNYWKNKNSSENEVSSKGLSEASLKIPAPGIGSIFGKDFVEIKPNGSVTLDFAGKWQRVQNPNIPVRQQRTGGFDFDQQISLNMIGTIGDKLKLTANWDTKASFDFQNNLKLAYTGYEEDIIQSIEAGNVTMPINSTLISGSQNLFGVKTKLQFGRLSVTAVMSSQRGKQEEITIEGGSQTRDFEVRADQYDAYRHFFLSHFFRKNYEQSLKRLPTVLSGVKVTRVDIYVTNTNNNTQNTRTVVGYLDLGESDSTIHNSTFRNGNSFVPSDNDTLGYHNTLFKTVREPQYRNIEFLPQELQDLGLNNGSDYVIVNNARRLTDREFKFHPDLGYISLSSTIRLNEVVAVAYEYTYNGRTFQVGEIPGKGGVDTSATAPLILKMLKPNSVNTRLPTWDLMMKNVYQLGSSQMSQENFKLNIIYKNDQSGADLPFLQEGERTNRVLLVRLSGLDRLGPNMDPPGDGNFDYIDGVTVDSRTGKIIFPVLEPFGSNMNQYFNPGETSLKEKYVFQELYDSTASDMLNYARKNKYFLKGKYQAGSGSEIPLPGINIAQGSVIVTAGSTPLVADKDYRVDYAAGKIYILNSGILESGQTIKVRFEKTDLFNFRRKSFLGTRMDYRINNDVNIGGTLLHQSEAPQISRVSIGDEPSKNTIAGLDFTFSKESRFLTKAVDLLPVIQTKAPSAISFRGEGAGLFPGHSKAINKGGNEGGVSYLDDFEGAETAYTLTTSTNKWVLGSTPSKFSESTSSDIDYTYGRARMAWYNVDNMFYRDGGASKPDHISEEDVKNHFIRQVMPQEVFPNRDPQTININEPVLNLAYYPSERGPYNYNPNLTTDGRLPNPKESWGAVTRAINNDIDFDNANIQYIEFWMMSPYINSKKNYTEIEPGQPFNTETKGKLYFNLGSVSEDVMKDQKHAFENGLPIKEDEKMSEDKVYKNKWGVVTKQAFLTKSFDNAEGSRPLQDVGLDGLSSTEEMTYFDTTFINKITLLNPNSAAYSQIISDPSADDFQHYLGQELDNAKASILQRYKRFNGMENNSPINSSDGSILKSSTTIPDNEDINDDNNVDVTEEYYEYEIDIDPTKFMVGNNYIVDKQVVTDAQYAHGDSVTWYQFRIPVRDFDSKFGNINGFKSIKFMRMYMTGFEDPVILRFVELQLVANQWRAYNNELYEPSMPGPRQEVKDPSIVVSSVNIEENGFGDADNVAYTTPPGFSRDQDLVSQTQRQLSERSLQICVDNLGDGQSKAAFKYVNFNLLNYKRIKMFLSAQSKVHVPDSGVYAFVRIGTDFEENYYEIEIPLHYTHPRASLMSAEEVWKAENNLDVSLEELVAAKLERNEASGGVPQYNKPFKSFRDGRTIIVVGNPDLSAVQTVMIGLKNPTGGTARHAVQTCIWANELLVSDFVESAGYAAMATMSIQLADLATISSSIRYTGAGFGSLDQKVSQRERNNTLQYGIASNITLDKFLPHKLGIKLPFYISHDRKLIMPKYDPLDPDVKLMESVNSKPEELRDSYRDKVMDETITNSWNFTNVRKVKTKPNAKSHFYDVENLAFTFGVTHRTQTNSNLKEYDFKNWKAGAGYTFNSSPKSYEPFKKLKWKTKYARLIKDFNFTLLPSSVTVRTDFDRRLTKTVYYAGNPIYDIVQDPLYEKSFTNNRNYGLNWNFTKSLTADFSANTFAVIDEPDTLTPGTSEYNQALQKEALGMGRKKNYSQTVGLNYKLPLDKLPLTDWIALDTRYSAGYNWTASARDLQDTLGNLIANKQDINLNGRLNLDKLYNKVGFLKKINSPTRARKKIGPQLKPTNPKDSTAEEEKPKKELKALKQAFKVLMSMKMITATYTYSRGTSMGGYLPGVDYMGMEHGKSDMLPFIFGSQNANIRETLTKNNWYSKSSMLNTPFNQTAVQNLNIKTSLEPFRDFRIQVDALKNKTSNYQEIYRNRYDSTISDFRFVSDAPLRSGSYSISFIAIKTSFIGQSDPEDPNSSKVFDRFEAYRHNIQKRRENGEKYGINSQEILVPAFIAAYSGRSPNKVGLSSFPSIPLPNWRIDYNGLSKIKSIGKLFTMISISHGYQSTFTISGFTSSLSYANNGNVINPSTDFDDPVNPNNMLTDQGKYVSPYVIDQVIISEKFAPLIGLNFRTKTKFEGRIEYVRDRTLALSMANAQIQELTNNGIVVGIGYSKAGIKLPIATGGNPYTILKNEVKFRIDVAIRDGKTVQRKIEDASTTTQGNLNWQLKPTINYLVNQRLNLNFYFERTMNVPKISSSFKRSTTAFGVQLRFTLS